MSLDAVGFRTCSVPCKTRPVLALRAPITRHCLGSAPKQWRVIGALNASTGRVLQGTEQVRKPTASNDMIRQLQEPAAAGCWGSDHAPLLERSARSSLTPHV